jgi:hypothetical protein
MGEVTVDLDDNLTLVPEEINAVGSLKTGNDANVWLEKIVKVLVQVQQTEQQSLRLATKSQGRPCSGLRLWGNV